MDEFAVAAYLGRTALAGAVVLALGRAALLLARSPTTRQRLAAGTLRAAVLVPLLALLPSWWAVTVPSSAVAVEAVAPEPATLPVEPPAPPVEWVADPEWVEVEAPAFDAVEPVVVEPQPAVVEPRQRTWRDAVAVIAAVYAAGVAYFLGVFALGHLALVRLRRGATLAPGRVLDAWGSRRPPALLVHDALASPVCFGVVRPAVVLPVSLVQSATAGQLAWVLAHEADHLRRGDPLTGWFAGLAKALFFFAPWFWGVRRELRLAQEYLADAAALAAGGHAADYAEFLVDLTAAPVRGRRTLLAHGVRAGRSDLSRRITMVLSTTPPPPPRRWATPAAAGLFAVAVALSGVTVVRADDKPKEPPAAPQPPEAKPARATDARDATETVPPPRWSYSGPGVTVEQHRKQIDEALAAGATEEARKLIDGLVGALTKPPAPPQPPAGDRRSVLAIQSADPRILDALTAMRTAIDATKNPEARAAMESAFRLLRDMPQERRLTQTFVGPDGRETVLEHSPWFGAVGGPGGAPSPSNYGVAVAPLPEALAEHLQFTAGLGVVVTEVRPDSPFAKAGVRKNDVITSVNSVVLKGGPAQLRLELSKVSGKFAVTVVNKGVEKMVEVELPQPREAFARPAAKKVRFESLKLEVVGGRVLIEAKQGDRRYKITGTQVGEQLDKPTVTITNLKTNQEYAQVGTVLGSENTMVDEQDRAAVRTLLDQIRGQ